MGRQLAYFCIIVSMSKYAYQIQGALESQTGKFLGLRVLVCNVNFLNTVDVPAEVLDHNTIRYLQFRISITKEAPNIKRLPIEIQNKIRAPLGRWLDHWVLENFYGNNKQRESTDPGLVEASPQIKSR